MRRFSKTTFHCPNCDKILTVATHIGDYIHDCRDFPVIEVNATQDVTNIGDSTEFGAVVVTSLGAQEVMRQGAANTVWGERSSLEGDDVPEFTERGNNQFTKRQRAHFEYIELTF